MPLLRFLISSGEGSAILVLRLPLVREWGSSVPCQEGNPGVLRALARSGLLQGAVPSCQCKFPAQDLAEGSPPGLSSSSSPPRWPCVCWDSLKRARWSWEGCLCLHPTFYHAPGDREHKNGSLLLSVLLTAMIR